MIENSGYVIAYLIFVLIGVASWFYRLRKIEPAIERGLHAWQSRTGYQIVELRKSWVGGPFALTSSRYQVVYRVGLMGPAGERLGAYARVGSFWGGVFWRPDLVKVIPDGPDFTPIPDPGHD